MGGYLNIIDIVVTTTTETNKSTDPNIIKTHGLYLFFFETFGSLDLKPPHFP